MLTTKYFSQNTSIGVQHVMLVSKSFAAVMLHQLILAFLSRKWRRYRRKARLQKKSSKHLRWTWPARYVSRPLSLKTETWMTHIFRSCSLHGEGHVSKSCKYFVRWAAQGIQWSIREVWLLRQVCDKVLKDTSVSEQVLVNRAKVNIFCCTRYPRDLVWDYW